MSHVLVIRNSRGELLDRLPEPTEEAAREAAVRITTGKGQLRWTVAVCASRESGVTPGKPIATYRRGREVTRGQ